MSTKYTFAKILIIPAFFLSLVTILSFFLSIPFSEKLYDLAIFLAGHTSILCIIAAAIALGLCKIVRKKTGVKRPRWLRNMGIYSIVFSAFMFGAAVVVYALGKVF